MLLRAAAAGAATFASLAALVAWDARAAENAAGIYLLGVRGPMAGYVPPPGLYFQNDVYLYSGSANASRELPFNGQLIAEVKGKMAAEIPTLLWSTPLQFAGGNLAFSATLPIGGPRIDAGATLSAPPLNAVLAHNVHDSVATIGDPLLSGLVAWHSGNFHWNAGVMVNVPVGDYQAGELANLAFHRWGSDFFGAGTWNDPATGHELSGAVGITFNGRNPVTDYKTGTEFHAEAAAVHHFSKQFDLGLVGYFYDQIGGDSGSGAKLGAFKGRVAALGGTLGYTFLAGQTPISTRVRIYREFDVQNRLQGTAAFLSVAIPISVAAPAPTVTAKPLITK